MNIHQAQAIVNMVQSNVDTYPGETAEARASAYYNEAVEILSTMHVMGACAYFAAFGSIRVRPRMEEC